VLLSTKKKKPYGLEGIVGHKELVFLDL